MTCRTCLTLNPPGAPACVRCNTPLEEPPAGPDPARPEAARPDPARPEAARPDPARPEAARPDPARPEAARPDPQRPDAARPDPARPDPTVGSKQLGPGLAAPVRAAPGSSRVAVAAEQPPGYGPPAPLAPEPGEPGQPGQPDLPGQGDSSRRRVAVAGLAVVALVLAGGGTALWLTRPAYLDTAAVAGEVGAELTARLGGAVAVTCPDGVRSRAGETFACTARDAAGTSRPVTVTVLDDAGRYRWELGR